MLLTITQYFISEKCDVTNLVVPMNRLPVYPAYCELSSVIRRKHDITNSFGKKCKESIIRIEIITTRVISPHQYRRDQLVRQEHSGTSCESKCIANFS